MSVENGGFWTMTNDFPFEKWVMILKDEVLDQVGEMYHDYRHDLKLVNYKTYDQMAFGFGLFSMGSKSLHFFLELFIFF